MVPDAYFGKTVSDILNSQRAFYQDINRMLMLIYYEHYLQGSHFKMIYDIFYGILPSSLFKVLFFLLYLVFNI